MDGDSAVGPQTKLRASGSDDYDNRIFRGHRLSLLFSAFHK